MSIFEKRKKESHTIGVILPKEKHETLKEISKKHKISLSEVVRTMIDYYLGQHGN
jgi:metal-responsive CopG/Arc/MetJ family transcriptional regulator